MQANINRKQLFIASCLALLVTSLSFGIRAGILGKLGTDFQLSATQLATIASTAFWGFPLAVIIGGMVVDIIGMKRLLEMAFVFHLAGILLTIFAGGFWSLFISTLLIGIANGTVEAACNPLVTALYPEDKTTKLNHFHLWFPGGIVIGTLISYYFTKQDISWQIQVATMLIPTAIYGFLFFKLKFPVTERVAAGVSTGEMYKSLANPLFIFMIILMFGTAITELFTGQWIEVLLKNVTDDALLILTISTGVMVIGRGFAARSPQIIANRCISNFRILIGSWALYIGQLNREYGICGCVGIWFGCLLFLANDAWFCSGKFTKNRGGWIKPDGGAGMFAVSIYTIIMGKFYDNKLIRKLPAGTELAAYSAPGATPEMQAALTQAKTAAGPEIINATLVIPIILTVAFIGLFFYMRNRTKPQLTATAKA